MGVCYVTVVRRERKRLRRGLIDIRHLNTSHTHMLLLQGLLWLAALIFTGAGAKSSTGTNVLVVVEPEHQDEYSLFFQGLKGILLRQCCNGTRALMKLADRK